MNERFKELAELCYEVNPLMVENSQKIGNDGVSLYREVFNQEKFAELIVQECVQYIEDKFDFCGDELIIAEKLKEHFGVES